MEGEKLERRERDFENGIGRHGGERKRKYASGGGGRHISFITNYSTIIPILQYNWGKYSIITFFI